MSIAMLVPFFHRVINIWNSVPGNVDLSLFIASSVI